MPWFLGLHVATSSSRSTSGVGVTLSVRLCVTLIHAYDVPLNTDSKICDPGSPSASGGQTLLYDSVTLTHVHVCMLNHFSSVRLCDARTVARQVPLFVGFSRQDYWDGLPFIPPGVLPDPRIEPASLKSPALAGRFFPTSTT